MMAQLAKAALLEMVDPIAPLVNVLQLMANAPPAMLDMVSPPPMAHALIALRPVNGVPELLLARLAPLDMVEPIASPAPLLMDVALNALSDILWTPLLAPALHVAQMNGALD